MQNNRRDDLLVVAKKLREGHPVPQGLRTTILGDPIATFYVGDDRVLRIFPIGNDRIICLTKDGSMDLFFGEKGMRELKELLAGFIKAGQLSDAH